MNFILDNYIIIIFIGLFFVFALIGYLIDSIKNNKTDEKDNKAVDINTIDIKTINLPKQKEVKEIEEKNILDNYDELLNNYDNSTVDN